MTPRDLTQQSVPVLNAVLAKGIAEKNKPEKDTVDKKIITRAISAAKEISQPQGASTASGRKTRPIMIPPHVRADGAKTCRRGNAYLDFARKYKASLVQATKEMAAQAADRAVYLAAAAQEDARHRRPM